MEVNGIIILIIIEKIVSANGMRKSKREHGQSMISMINQMFCV